MEELVIMDEVAFLLQGGVEYVFKKGSYFTESGKEKKDYDYSYALVAPVNKAPMVMFLTMKQ